MPRSLIYDTSKLSPRSTYTQFIEKRYAAFEARRSLLQQKKNALESEAKTIEVVQKKLEAAKRNIELQKMRIESERAREDMRLFEDVFDKALSSMLRLASDYLDQSEREKLLRGIETKVRYAVRDVEKILPSKKVRVGTEILNRMGIGVVNVLAAVKCEAPVLETHVNIPEKRTATRAGFRQAYVESDDDDGS